MDIIPLVLVSLVVCLRLCRRLFLLNLVLRLMLMTVKDLVSPRVVHVLPTSLCVITKFAAMKLQFVFVPSLYPVF